MYIVSEYIEAFETEVIVREKGKLTYCTTCTAYSNYVWLDMYTVTYYTNVM